MIAGTAAAAKIIFAAVARNSFMPASQFPLNPFYLACTEQRRGRCPRLDVAGSFADGPAAISRKVRRILPGDARGFRRRSIGKQMQVRASSGVRADGRHFPTIGGMLACGPCMNGRDSTGSPGGARRSFQRPFWDVEPLGHNWACRPSGWSSSKTRQAREAGLTAYLLAERATTIPSLAMHS